MTFSAPTFTKFQKTGRSVDFYRHYFPDSVIKRPKTIIIFARMKIFAFLFSLYIFALALVPCCPIANCQDEASLSQKAGDCQQHDGCQNCSPFNQCDNCVGFTLTGNGIHTDRPPHAAEMIFSHSGQFFFTQYISSFWQPPKLG